jgi:CRP-like cAMP-binding protein
MTNLIVARTAHTLSARVLAVLEHLAVVNAVPQANGERVLPVSQTDVAHAVGASRQAVNEALRGLEKTGHIRLGYRSVVFPAPSKAP